MIKEGEIATLAVPNRKEVARNTAQPDTLGKFNSGRIYLSF